LLTTAKFTEGKSFYPSYDFDENGILYWLGTKMGTSAWSNPAELGLVQVTSSPLAVNPVSQPASAICGRTTVRCVTQAIQNSWFCVDFVNLYIRPCAYTLRHYDTYDNEALYNWQLLASNDGKRWVKLMDHQQDGSLDKKGATKTWLIPNVKNMYRMFRIYLTGNPSLSFFFFLSYSYSFFSLCLPLCLTLSDRNNAGHFYLACSGFEIYGHVYSQLKE
jgi:E3 ubiquitin-protein ligase HECTD1